MAKKQNGSFEVHTHHFISGPRANGGCYSPTGTWMLSKFSHSHEGGDKPHQHPQTGPAAYTIDKDDWFRSTGLRGGGRKKFTVKPSGEQMPIRELEDWQKSFEIIVCDPPKDYIGEGPGIGPAARMTLTFRMSAHVVDQRGVK